jgi:Plasmid pRiA4b ORF-3-like protein
MHANDTPATWLLARGVDGLGLTKTGALQRTIVREAAERWPHWWNHDLFGAPNREAELPVLEETHAGLRHLRLLRKNRETLRTAVRGRELLDDPGALLGALRDGVPDGEPFDSTAWPLIEAALRDHGPLAAKRLEDLVAPRLWRLGWSGDLGWAISPLLWRAEGYGLVQREHPGIDLTASARRLVGPDRAAGSGDVAVVFDAELVNVRGVRACLAVLERQPLTALHDAMQEAFGWYDDHLYSFWLDGRFWGDEEVTSPDVPDEAERTADLPIAELDLRVGRRIAYVFDFGDEWRVRLTVRERVAATGDHPRVLELRGTPPPQYA